MSPSPPLAVDPQLSPEEQSLSPWGHGDVEAECDGLSSAGPCDKGNHRALSALSLLGCH